MSSSTPVLPAVQTAGGPGRSPQSHVWCPWCESVHSHSVGAGLRAAHCHRKESPFLARGYDLNPVGSSLDADAVVPDGLLVGQRRLSAIFETAATKPRAAFLKHVVGRKRLGRARISVSNSYWSIEADMTAYGPGADRIDGVGLLGLLSALYGVGRGVAGVRLLEAVTGEKFDALARLTIAEAIDAAAVRATRSSEDRP